MNAKMEPVRVDAETGEKLYRGTQKLTIRYKGLETTVDMPGWYSTDGEIGEYTKQDMKVSDRALNSLKAQAEALPSPAKIRQIRKRLHLTQEQAGMVIGGGKRAFQKYEAGDILPSRTLANLLRVLEQYPAALGVLKG